MVLLLGGEVSFADHRWIALGPEGGKVKAVFASPSQSDTVYAGMSRGGVFRSTNGGVTWGRFSRGMTVSQVYDFAEDSAGTLYAATRRGIYRRPAGATAWQSASEGLPTPYAFALDLQADPVVPGRVYAIVSPGPRSSPSLWISEDSGGSWSRESGAFFADAMTLLATSPPTLVVASFLDIRIQQQDGTWMEFKDGIPEFPVPVDLEAHPTDPRIVYAVIRDQFSGESKPYKSVDGGRSWQPRAAGLAEGFANGVDADTDLVIDPRSPDTLYLGTRFGLYRSDDGAGSWFPVNAAPGDAPSDGIATLADGSLLVGSTGRDGVLRSDDGGNTWKTVASGFLGRIIDDVTADPLLAGRVVAADSQGLLFSDDDGITWQIPDGVSSAGASRLLRDPDQPSNLLAVSGIQLLASVDGGASWQLHGGEVEDVIASLAWDESGETLYRTSSGALWASDDGGLSWSERSGPLCDRPLFLAPPRADGVLIAGCTGRLIEGSPEPASSAVSSATSSTPTTKDLPQFSASLLRSDDGGQTWSVTLPDLQGTFSGEWSFSSGSRTGAVFASLTDPFSGRVWKSEDGGTTWELLESLDWRLVRALAIDPTQSEHVLAGTFDYGVLESHDGGTTWQEVNDGLVSARVLFLEFDAGEPSRIWAGTEAGVQTVGGPAPECRTEGEFLCLLGRFRAEVTWTDFDGNSGRGMASPITDNTGGFWFFGPDNLEFALKVLDGRELNDHFWLFYGGLSTVQYTLTVTDLVTGDLRVVENDSGNLTGAADTSAFFDPSDDPIARPPDLAPVLEGPISLQDDRFEVEVRWRTLDGQSGTAGHRRLSPDTAAFYFFSAGNLEVFAKVLDGRSINGRFWLFFTGLSDVAYDLIVTDTVTGSSRTYSNQQGNFGGQVDIELF